MNKVKSLYIHIPFCNQICDYCDFTKLQYFRNFAVSYLTTLKKELASYDIQALETIYVGGGTPTALDDDLFEELLKIIKPYTGGVKEYTFEANPESLTLSKIKALKENDVNRISIGVQTTNDKMLKALNRHHTFEDVKKAVALLKENGIDNINVDLILGLPHANEKQLIEDLDNILSLGVKHVSCYGLSVNPHTVLFTKGYQEPNPDLLRKYYDIVEERLISNGYIHYEVSNWSKEGYQSLHNLTYWRNEQYFGVGLGASGYVGEVRYKNTVNLAKYLKGQYRQEEEIVTPKDRFTYQVMLNLRTKEGLSLKLVKEEFGIDLLETKGKEIASFIEQDYLINQCDCLIPTYQGMMILDQLILALI